MGKASAKCIKQNRRGSIMLATLMAVSSLLAFTGVGFTRSMTELRVTHRFLESVQALELAEAGIDEAQRRILADDNDGGVAFTNPAFNGRVNNDPNQPLQTYNTFNPARAGCAFTIEPLDTQLNPFSTRTVNGIQRFIFAEERRFEIVASGMASGGITRRIRAVIARASDDWEGAATDEQIYIRRHNVNATGYLYGVDPSTDITEIFGNLRSDWNTSRNYSGPFPNVARNPITVPSGSVVHGDIIIGVTPATDPGDGWQRYFFPSSSPPTGNGGGSNRDGVWLGPGETVDPADPGSVYMDPAQLDNPLIGITDTSDQVVVNSAQLTPPAVDSNGNDCTNPPDFQFGDDLPATQLVSSVLPGGVYCYNSYMVGDGDSVVYDGPTQIYVTGDHLIDHEPGGPPGSNIDTMISIDIRATVGVLNNPQSPPPSGAIPDPSLFASNAITFRSTGTWQTRAMCLSNFHGTIVAPNSWMIFHHVGNLNDPVRANRYGSIFTRYVEVRPGANVVFSDGVTDNTPWIRLVMWQEL